MIHMPALKRARIRDLKSWDKECIRLKNKKQLERNRRLFTAAKNKNKQAMKCVGDDR